MEIRKKTTFVSDEGFEFNFEPIENTIEIEEKEDGYVARYLTRDEYPPSPDEFGDNNLVIVNYHDQCWIDRPEIVSKEEIASFYHGEETHIDEDYWVFPVKSYIHGMARLALGRGGFAGDPGGWDTSHVGACLASKEEFHDRKHAQEACEAMVETWNEYLMGDVYCTVKEELNENKIPIHYDIVGGYYGKEFAEEELDAL